MCLLLRLLIIFDYSVFSSFCFYSLQRDRVTQFFVSFAFLLTRTTRFFSCAREFFFGSASSERFIGSPGWIHFCSRVVLVLV